MRTHRLLLAAGVGLLAAPLGAGADIAIDKDDMAPSATTPSRAPSQDLISTNAPPGGETTAAEAPSPPVSTRTEELEQRFAHGKAVEAEGNLPGALAIFDSIIADAPDAKGSLREAGLISVEMGDAARADGYFTKLHALVPDYPMAIEALIQVNEALKREAKVEILIKEFKDLHAAGRVPEPYFVRERIHLDGGTEIAITQFFDYHQPRYYAWAAELFDARRQLKRRLTVNFDPDVTATMRKDPKLANAEQFLVVDNVMTDGRVTRLDVYQQYLSLPDYRKMRTVLMEIFAHALKPIDSAPVPQGAP